MVGCVYTCLEALEKRKGQRTILNVALRLCCSRAMSAVSQFSPTLESEGSLLQFGFLTLTLRNPRMFKMFMGPKPSLAITHPDLARQVLTRHQERDVSICFFQARGRKEAENCSAQRGNSHCALFSCQDFRKADNDAIASKSIQAPLNYTKDGIQALHEKQCLFRRSSAVCFLFRCKCCFGEKHTCQAESFQIFHQRYMLEGPTHRHVLLVCQDGQNASIVMTNGAEWQALRNVAKKHVSFSGETTPERRA